MREVSIYMDNQAVITAMGMDALGLARHIIDMIHAQQCQHRRLTRTHAWV